MKNTFKIILMMAFGFFSSSAIVAQNVSVNMLVLNAGIVPLGSTGTVNATINASLGTAGQSSPVAAGKLRLAVTVPPSLLIATTQNNLPAGWTVLNNDGTVINICNSSASIAVNTAIDLPITLEGVTITSGSPIISGQITFRNNCNPGPVLSGDNPADNSSQAGFSVTTPTPVILSDFNASLINCQPSLNWTTETEINSSKFEIERAAKDLSNWVSVGAINATGNSSSKIKYKFVDQNIAASTEKVFYRLKMIDKDGRFKFSDVLPVFTNCNKYSMSVFPNPVDKGRLYIVANGLQTTATVSLLSLAGQVILKTLAANGTSVLDVSKIVKGIYVLNIQGSNGVDKRIKVVINN